MFSNVEVAAVEFPGVVVIDTREQRPFAFDGLFADANRGHAPLAIRTVRGTLESGDYSLQGFEKRIACERKSLADLYSTIGQDRQRFERELCRLAAYDFSAVVVEADWSTILHQPPARSQLHPKIVFRTVLAWQQRYPGTHWWLCPDREFAELTTFRILERYWRDETSNRSITRPGSFATMRARVLVADVLTAEERASERVNVSPGDV